MTHTSAGLWRPQETYNHGRRGSKHILLPMVAGKWSAEQKGGWGKLLIKPSDFMRTHSLSWEQRGGNRPHDSNTSHWVPHNTWGLWELQFKMRFGWGHSQTISGRKKTESYKSHGDMVCCVPTQVSSWIVVPIIPMCRGRDPVRGHWIMRWLPCAAVLVVMSEFSWDLMVL